MTDTPNHPGFWRRLLAALADERTYMSVEEWRDRRIAELEREVQALRAQIAKS